MNRWSPAWMVLSMVLATLMPSAVAWADDADQVAPAESTRPTDDRPTGKPAERTVAPASHAVAAAACLPAYAPVYIEDWDRLAALTQGDPLIASRAEFWAKRRNQANWVLATSLFLGAGSATLGALDWLNTGESSRAGKMIPVGLSVALASYLAYLAFAPDRDDLLTIINQWNLRHRDRQLAP